MDIEKNNGQFLKLCKTASWSRNKILPMRLNGKQKLIAVYFILNEVLTWKSCFLIGQQNLTYAPERETKFQISLF